jgi:hypothetical protein
MSRPSRSAVLHIGTEKTGTTTIQALLARRRKELSDLGFWYPPSPGEISHVALAAFAAPENMQGVPSPPIRNGQFDEEEFARRLHNEMAMLPAHVRTVIFSNEHCHSRLTSTGHVHKLKNFLTPYFDTITVVVYLRRQDEMACSSYSTLLRGGDACFNLLPRVPAPGTSTDTHRDYLWSRYFDFEGLLERYALVFDKQFVRPRLFEPASLEHNDVATDFLKACGLPRWLGDGAGRVNRAIPADGQHFLALLNAYLAEPSGGMNGGNTAELRDICASIVETRLDGAPRLPTRGEAQRFYSQFRDMNDRVRAAWFPAQSTLFSEDFSRYPEAGEDAGAPQPERALHGAFLVIKELINEQAATANALRAQAEASQTQLIRAQAAQIEIARRAEALAAIAQEGVAARTEVKGRCDASTWRYAARIRAAAELLRSLRRP